VLPHWLVIPNEEGRWAVSMELAVDTSRAENHLEENVAAATQ